MTLGRGNMALKKTVADIESVPEAFRSEYEQVGDVYKLKLDDADDSSGLKSALDKERKARADAERKHKDLVKQFEGIDPEKARTAAAQLQELNDKKLLADGDIEALLRSRTERMAADHAAQVQAAQARIQDLETRHNASETRLGEVLIDGTIKDVAGKAGVRKTLSQALVRIARAGDVDGIRWDIRDGQPTPLVGESVKYGKDPTKPMSVEEYVDVVRQKMPDLFEPSTGTGTVPGASGAQSRSSFVLTREQARDQKVYVATREAAAKAGQSVQITD